MEKLNLTFGELKPLLNLEDEEYVIVFLTSDADECICNDNWVHYNNGTCYILDQDCKEIELDMDVDNLKVLKIGVGSTCDCAIYVLDNKGYLNVIKDMLCEIYED